MKLRQVLSFLVILILLSSFASAGFFGTLLSIITGKAVADEGFYVEFNPTLDLSGSDTCNGNEKTYILKSTSEDLIEITGAGVKVKEVYVTKGGCKGVYYKDDKGKVVSLKAIGADLVIRNRHYTLSVNSGVDLSSVFGEGYSTIETAALTSDDRTMQVGDAVSKTKTVYLYEAGTTKKILFVDSEGNIVFAPSVKEKIAFDLAQTLVPKKAEEKPKAAEAKAEKAVAAWDEQRVAAIEKQVTVLTGQVNALTAKLEELGVKAPELEGQKVGFWKKLFRG